MAAVEAAGQGHPAASYEAVLDASGVDAVYIPLPNAMHREWTLKALAAGKHVLCEKPLVLSAAEVDELGQAAAAANRVVMEAFMYRLHPQYEQPIWRPLLAEIGAVRFAQVRVSFPFNRPGDIREDPELGVAPYGTSEAIASMRSHGSSETWLRSRRWAIYTTA